jgi:NADPH-dependent curcumin reductase CurA
VEVLIRHASSDDDFRSGSEPIPELSEGQFLLRVRYLSLDRANPNAEAVAIADGRFLATMGR